MNIEKDEVLDGVSAKQLFETSTIGLTYRDFIILPGYINFNASEVDLKTKLTKNIELKRPFISSPMDTVTESEMAIAQALTGGIGIIHYNNTIDRQVSLVRKVKRFENGFITDPIILSPKNKIEDLDKIKERYGFSGIPITEDGTKNSKLIGIVTNRDVDFEKDRSILLEQVMTRDLVTISKDIDLKEANKVLKAKKIGKLPIVDQNGYLVSLLSRSDLKKNKNYPDSTKDKNKRLRVGAAVSTLIESRDRVVSLYEAGVDVIIIDAAQGNSIYQTEMIEFIKKNCKDLDVVAGNVVTRAQARNLIKAGADGLRVGMGPGSICITQDTMAVGRAQATAVFYTSLEASKYGIPVIADGGISNIGDISNALAIGASSCMMGFLFSGTHEAPGDYFYENGIRLKKYRGMASLEAMKAGGDKRYFNSESNVKVAQGVSGSVPDRGSIFNLIPYLSQGLRLSFQDMGIKSLQDLHKFQQNGNLRFEKRTESAQKQGSVHGLYSFNSPNLIET